MKTAMEALFMRYQVSICVCVWGGDISSTEGMGCTYTQAIPSNPATATFTSRFILSFRTSKIGRIAMVRSNSAEEALKAYSPPTIMCMFMQDPGPVYAVDS